MTPLGAINVLTLFQIGYYAAILFFLIHATVIIYHWYSFGADRKKSLLGAIVYLTVSSILLLAMGAALLSI